MVGGVLSIWAARALSGLVFATDYFDVLNIGVPAAILMVEFDRMTADEHFGSITVRQAWGGVLTSCAWHGGQIIFIVNRLLAKAGASVTSS